MLNIFSVKCLKGNFDLSGWIRGRKPALFYLQGRGGPPFLSIQDGSNTSDIGNFFKNIAPESVGPLLNDLHRETSRRQKLILATLCWGTEGDQNQVGEACPRDTSRFYCTSNLIKKKKRKGMAVFPARPSCFESLAVVILAQGDRDSNILRQPRESCSESQHKPRGNQSRCRVQINPFSLSRLGGMWGFHVQNSGRDLQS